jgi:hypothetical protein
MVWRAAKTIRWSNSSSWCTFEVDRDPVVATNAEHPQPVGELVCALVELAYVSDCPLPEHATRSGETSACRSKQP